MKKKPSTGSIWLNIKMVDRFLILIMVILYIYSILTIYLPTLPSPIVGSVDLVVRTTIASIFGYFISSNFIKTEASNGARTSIDNWANISDNLPTPATSDNLATTEPTAPSTDQTPTPTAKIGFTATEQLQATPQQIDMGAITDQPFAQTQKNENSFTNQLQILIIGVLCIVSIVLLILTRYSPNTGSSDIAGLSQLRDIVCGSIGFLIGTPSDATNS